jgi:7-cyano-7-deazaguanine reductase
MKNKLKKLHQETLKNTEESIKYMAKFGIKPEGRIELFRSPETREKSIDTIPYNHKENQVVVYETPEFSAQCPFSGLPDYGILKIEYIPGSRYLELKSLKYYIISWRNIGLSQEEITATIFSDILKCLKDPKYLVIETRYNVRGGISTTCKIDSREQKRK